jgi:iron complex outermembrane receptor protein
MKRIFKKLTLIFVGFILQQPIRAGAIPVTGKTQPIWREAPPVPGGVIKGAVITSDGKPAASVTVVIRGTKRSTQTDDDGHFTLRNVSPGDYTLDVSLVGYESSARSVTVTEKRTAVVSLQLTLSQKQLEGVIVTAGRSRLTRAGSDDLAKTPLTNLENPQVYSTVTQGLMTEQSVFNLDDALKNVPGASRLWASTDRAGFGNGAAFVLRGFELNSYLRNGVPGNVSTTIDNANIESIEVLKGPSATLFGSAVTAYGGLINRVTKKPYDRFGGEITYAGGSYGFNRLSADVNAPLDTARKVLLRVNAAYNATDSWQDRGFHKSFFVAPSLSYKVNDRLSFGFDAELYRSRGTTPSIFFFDATVAQLGVSSADKLNIDWKRSFISNDLAVQSSNANFFGQMNYKLSDQWLSQTNISVANSSSYGPMPYFYLLPGNSQIARNVWTIDGNDRTLDVQQNFIGRFSIGPVKNRLVAGLDLYNYNANVIYHEFLGTADGQTASDLFDVVNSAGDIPNYLNFNKAKVDSAYANSPASPYPYTIFNKVYISSAYVSDVVNITDRLLINAALRIDHYDNKGTYDPTSGSTTGAYHQTALSPKFGLVYQLAKDRVSVFGNYLNGFTNETGTDYAGHAFKPEQANQWEGGIKANAFGGKLTGTVSYYDIKVKNVLRTDPDHPNFSLQNGTQLSTGIEAELIANPFTGFNIVAGYAHNNGKYTDADADVEGRRPGSSGPADMANLWLSYRITNGAAKGLGLGVGGNYSGVNIIESSASQGQFTCPSYTIVNASVFYDRPGYRLAVKVDNLGNKQYWIGWTTINPQMPLSLLATVAVKF